MSVSLYAYDEGYYGVHSSYIYNVSVDSLCCYKVAYSKGNYHFDIKRLRIVRLVGVYTMPSSRCPLSVVPLCVVLDLLLPPLTTINVIYIYYGKVLRM